jgi:hypothetical protein
MDDEETGIGIEFPISDETHTEIEIKQESVRTNLNNQINDVKCFWCRNSFYGDVYSIPIKYNPSHYSVPNGTAETKSFVEREVTIAERKMMEEEKLEVTVDESYLWDGAFCSGECRQAFLEEHVNEPLYKDSISLLKRCDSEGYYPAMSWRTLSEYGGKYSVDEFRRINSSKKSQYRENPINIGERYLERDFI